MKYLISPLWLAIAITMGIPALGQTWDESVAAYKHGDYNIALPGFKLMAEQGNAIAQYNVGLMFANGQGVPKDEQKALVWYRKSADQGNPDAQYNLGLMYFYGQGVQKDGQQATTWFRKSAAQGNANAQHNLGVLFDRGEGVPKDAQQAVMWYRKAAEQGYADAQFNLGSMYENGDGVPKDDQQAVMWFRKAAEQGNASAQASLGQKYYFGEGAPKNGHQALEWFRKAAEQGHASAQYNLGLAYYKGDGIPKDEQQSLEWFRKAAEQGHASAQYNLGLMYFKSQGVPKDEQMTYFWWLLASARGHQSASEGRELIERRLTSEQRGTAQSAARGWRPKTATHASALARAGGFSGFTSTPGSAANDQPDSTGSGFRIVRGAFVTNHHVIDDCSRLQINGVVAKLRGGDPRSDLALITAEVPGPSTNLRARRVAVGEPVAVAGYPLRGLLSGFNMTTGTLSSLSGMGGDTRLVQITAPVQPGNSGGPVLDSAGNLMGVVVSKLDAIKAAKITGDIPQNVNFAINANVLRSFLDANSVEYDTASSDKVLPTTSIAENAKSFTVLVECWK